jgi:hypothetical protein
VPDKGYRQLSAFTLGQRSIQYQITSGGNWDRVREFIEVESSKSADRLVLLKTCPRHDPSRGEIFEAHEGIVGFANANKFIELPWMAAESRSVNFESAKPSGTLR